MPSAPGNTPSPPEIENIRERIKRHLGTPSGDSAAGLAATEATIEEQIALLQKLPRATLHTGNVPETPHVESLTGYSLNLTETIHMAASVLEKYGELLRRTREDSQLTREEKEELDRSLLENENNLKNILSEIAHLRLLLQTEGTAEKKVSIFQRFKEWFAKW